MIAGLVSGGLSGLGALLGQGVSASSVAQQEQFQSQQVSQQEQFQEQMSNTAYQRATADMKAAGLNPILAYSQGGASTPSGSSMSGSSIQGQNVLGTGVNSAVNAVSTAAQMANTQMDTINKSLQGALIGAQTTSALSQARLNASNADIKGPEATAAKFITDNVGNGVKALDDLTNSAGNALSNWFQSHPDVTPKNPQAVQHVEGGSDWDNLLQ